MTKLLVQHSPIVVDFFATFDQVLTSVLVTRSSALGMATINRPETCCEVVALVSCNFTKNFLLEVLVQLLVHLLHEVVPAAFFLASRRAIRLSHVDNEKKIL